MAAMPGLSCLVFLSSVSVLHAQTCSGDGCATGGVGLLQTSREASRNVVDEEMEEIGEKTKDGCALKEGMVWGAGDAKCQEKCDKPTASMCDNIEQEERATCLERCNAKCQCNIATPAPTAFVKQPDKTPAEVQRLMHQKMGMNCNADVDSAQPTWSEFSGKKFGKCTVIMIVDKPVALKSCEGRCAKSEEGCNAFTFGPHEEAPDDFDADSEDDTEGECELVNCPIDMLDKGPKAVAEGHRTYTMGHGVNKNNLDPFTNISSWFWTYGLTPSHSSLLWGQEFGKEFVPLVNLKKPLPKESGQECNLALKDMRDFDDPRTCKPQQLINFLEETKRKIPVEFLMGYNEPYAEHAEDTHGQEVYRGKANKGITPEMGAEVWRRIVQPAAEQTGLKLVSPTTGISTQKTLWFIRFLQACYDNRMTKPFPCDVTKIVRWSIHEYKCYGSYWRKYADNVNGGENVSQSNPNCKEQPTFEKNVNIYTAFKDAMERRYGRKVAENFWNPYIDSVKLWVTETSCGGDNRYSKEAKLSVGLLAPTAEEQCKYITGKDCQREEGSVLAMLRMPNIERFSWFTTLPHPPVEHPNYDSITKGAMLDYYSGRPRPPGRALQALLDNEKARCTAKKDPNWDFALDHIIKVAEEVREEEGEDSCLRAAWDAEYTCANSRDHSEWGCSGSNAVWVAELKTCCSCEGEDSCLRAAWGAEYTCANSRDHAEWGCSGSNAVWVAELKTCCSCLVPPL